MLKIKDNVDLKELEAFEWELNTLDCFDTCSNCKLKDFNCVIKREQHYYKSIGNILQYTTIHTNNLDRTIYGVFDDYKTIYPTSKDYKYIEIACEDLIQAGLVEKVVE